MQKNTKDLNIAFWGTPKFAEYVLDALKEEGVLPSLVIAAPDKPRGRKLVVTPPETKVWAEENYISTYQPENIRTQETLETLKEFGPWDIFIVAAYGKIIPKEILDLPKYGTLNVHPSLLPKLRGASPIQSAILEEDETGVTIMLMDEDMDHGPIVAQEKTVLPTWPPKASDLEHVTAKQGGKLLAQSIPGLISGKIVPKEQIHAEATFTKKVTKEDGLLDLKDSPERNLRKVRAYDMWPRAYFFVKKNGKEIRIVVTEAEVENGKFVIKKVIPEGKKEIDYKDFSKE